MLKLYDRKSPINFKFGGLKTVQDMASDPNYKPILHGEVVLDVDDKGFTYAWYFLDGLKNKYGITELDPVVALKEVEDAIAVSMTPMTDPSITDLMEMLNDLGQAIVEQQMELDRLSGD